MKYLILASLFLVGCGASSNDVVDYRLNVSSTYSNGTYVIYDQIYGTQTIELEFTGRNYFQGGFSSEHFIVMMQGRLGEPGDVLQGIGPIIGNTLARPDGCNGVTIEAFNGFSNALYPDTCTTFQFLDNITYKLNAYAYIDGRVGYEIRRGDVLLGTGDIQLQNYNGTHQRLVVIGSTTPTAGRGQLDIKVLKYHNGE